MTVCTVVKSKLEISQKFVAFSEYMNFNNLAIYRTAYVQSKNVKFKPSLRICSLWINQLNKTPRFAEQDFVDKIDYIHFKLLKIHKRFSKMSCPSPTPCALIASKKLNTWDAFSCYLSSLPSLSLLVFMQVHILLMY